MTKNKALARQRLKPLNQPQYLISSGRSRRPGGGYEFNQMIFPVQITNPEYIQLHLAIRDGKNPAISVHYSQLSTIASPNLV